jgi:hypothetical protein
MHGVEDGMHRVGRGEFERELVVPELVAAGILGFGDAVTEEDEASFRGDGETDGVELGAGDESDGNVAVGDGLGGTVFKNKEGRDMAAVDEFDFTVGTVVQSEKGDVLLAGDT